jgi:hypothetical protein
MLAFQAKETTATTAKNAGRMPAVHEGGTPSLQDDNGEDRGQLRFAEGYAEQGCSRYTRARCPR